MDDARTVAFCKDIKKLGMIPISSRHETDWLCWRKFLGSLSLKIASESWFLFHAWQAFQYGISWINLAIILIAILSSVPLRTMWLVQLLIHAAIRICARTVSFWSSTEMWYSNGAIAPVKCRMLQLLVVSRTTNLIARVATTSKNFFLRRLNTIRWHW